MPSKIRHSLRPLPMYCWYDGGKGILDGPAVDPTTAPHDCMMLGCPGPENKRKLEAFDDLLAALNRVQRLFDEALPKFDWGASALDANAIQLLNEVPGEVRAAIAKAKGGETL